MSNNSSNPADMKNMTDLDIAPNVDEVLELGINKSVVSTIFELPTKTQLKLIKFLNEPTDEDTVEFLKFIGYGKPISKRTDFRRQFLPPPWNVLFSILNRTLTGNVGSPDQSRHNILEIMYGVYFDLLLAMPNLLCGK
ncbi:hypothetical protein L6452_40588 [Arctium lappa]|uniref:Uncharacterized protein n=1 Tax=Arctium lappa TaxID=4217 RepID=A0ACB8XMV8_ARCLA|nr:hypothetical protein L6452_40588 [Arctium lappa]